MSIIYHVNILIFQNVYFNVIFNFQLKSIWTVLLVMKTQLCMHCRGRFLLFSVLVNHLKMIALDQNMSRCSQVKFSGVD
jgi:hypothetical protein